LAQRQLFRGRKNTRHLFFYFYRCVVIEIMKSKRLASVFAVVCVCLAIMMGQVSAQSWLATTNIFNNWTSVAITADGTQIAASSFLGGIYTSTDGGTNWQSVGSPDESHRSVLASSTNGSSLVAAFYGGGIYGSADWGLTWTPLPAPVDNWNSLASSWDGTRLAVGASPGQIYTSKDSGATFTSRLPQNNSYQAIAGSVDGSNLVAIVSGGNIYRSTDSGQSWAITTAPAANWSSVATSTNGMNLVATVQGGGIYTSVNAGVSWAVTTAPNTNWSAVASSADGRHLVATVSSGYIYQSPDAGLAWNPLTTGLATNVLSTDTVSLTVISSNRTSLAFITNHFSTSLTNPTAVVTNGLVNLTNEVGIQILGAAVNAKKPVNINTFLGVNVQGNPVLGFGLLQTNLLGVSAFGSGATVTNSGSTNFFTARFALPVGALLTTNFINVLRTNLSGMSVTISNVAAINVFLAPAAKVWSAIASSADGSNLVAAANGGLIYYSTNSGTAWAVANAPATNWSALVFSPNGSHVAATVNGGLIYTSTNSGITWTTNASLIAVSSTVNAGTNWTTITNSVSSPSQSWSAVAVSADGSKLVAVVANGGIFTSTNSGATWQTNPTPWQVTDTEVFPATNTFSSASYSTWTASGIIWISNNVPNQDWSAVYSSPDGITLLALARYGWSFKSTNGGVTWAELSTPYDNWQSLASSSDGSKLLAAAQGGYVYLSTNSGSDWNELCIVPGNTNLILSDTLNLMSIYTNWNGFAGNTNALTTNLWTYNLGSFPSVGISNNVLGVTNEIGLNAIGTTVIGTNVLYIDLLLGVSAPGTNLLAFNPAYTNQLGTNRLGIGKVIAGSSAQSSLATTLEVPDTTGLFNPNGVLNTNIINAVGFTTSGLNLALTNILGVNVTIADTFQNWSSVAMSADGSHLVAAANGGSIYLSTNTGASWQQTGLPSANWSALTISADGSQLVAAVNGGLLYISSDSGVTWAAANLPAGNWNAVASSANGADLVAVIHGGAIYTEQSAGNPQTTTVPPLAIQLAGGNIVLSWPVSATTYVLQQSSNMMGTAWQDLTGTPTVSNGQNQVTLPMTANLGIYRLRK
jgi:photosystem II stability/assembly factor-like uncharacterized protein